jgi:hypothetical protein
MQHTDRLRLPGSFIVVSASPPTDFDALAKLDSEVPDRVFIHLGGVSPREIGGKPFGLPLMHSKVFYAHRNDLDVWSYVNDVLKQLLAGETEYEPMLPWNWAATHPENIREFRQEERRERDVRNQAKRAKRRAHKNRR